MSAEELFDREFYERYRQKGGIYVIPLEIFQVLLIDQEKLLEENEELKKQLEDANEKILLLQASEPMLNYKKALEENQQKEFIKYLENKIKKLENNHEHMVIDMFGSYDLNELDLNILKEILQKYKSIIGEDK